MSYHHYNPADRSYTQWPQYAPVSEPQSQYNITQPVESHAYPFGPHVAPIHPDQFGTLPSNSNELIGHAIAYPQLPQQWTGTTQISGSPITAYPLSGQYQEQPSKRRRHDDDETSTAVSKLCVSGNNSNLTPDSPVRKHKRSRKDMSENADFVQTIDPMAAARALAVAGTMQQSSHSDPDLGQAGRPLPIPGTYPDSSPEMPSKLPAQTLPKSQQPYSSSPQQLSTPPPSSLPGDQPNTPAAPTPEEPPLCPEQAELVDLICSGRNVFYTGSAGCGKSTVLKAFTKRLRAMGKKVRILAPTGRAALQVDGTTFWSFAGWTPDHLKRPLEKLKETAHGRFVYKRIKLQTDVIVFDEVSMIENHNFERLNELMKEAWYDPKREEQPAFGGVQVIVTGDFCQLPPVKPFEYCIECGKGMTERKQFGQTTYHCVRHGDHRDEDKWAFRSKAWHECNFEHVHLKQIHRQNDQEFIRMLQKCRIGDPLSSLEINKLMDHPCQVNNATRLFATRDQVREVNQKMFKRLTGVNHSYWCRDLFKWQPNHPHLQWKGVRKPEGPSGPDELRPLKALDDHRFDEHVELKQGMLVVLLINLDLQAGLCNGSQGLICGFEQYDVKKLPKAKVGKDEPENRLLGERALMKEQEIKTFIKAKGARFKRWPVVRFHNGQTRVIFADCSITELGDEQPYSLLARTQIPLAPAWAMTIHKSQSLTMDRVIVDLSRAFETGQVYVALSRATSLRGLKIEGDTDALTNSLGGNREVQRFLREKFGALNALRST
ncbi:ATP-dependent DNA helicase PIF1 [Seiridium cupressi]